jgi:hypothetical protein
MNPRLTITSHQNNQDTVWYLGGDIAEQGNQRTTTEQIQAAKKELKAIFPWFDFSQCQWNTLKVKRAEAKQHFLQRPSNPSIIDFSGIWASWPTKLAMAPLLSDNIIKKLQNEKIIAEAKQVDYPFSLSSPLCASLPWQE